MTQTESVVQTEVIDATATETIPETTTVTADATVTRTTGVRPGPPFKRAPTVRPTTCSRPTKRPTKISTAASACTNPAAYSSACLCLRIPTTTITAIRPTTTKTVIKTMTRSRLVTTTVRTIVYTTIDKTNTITTTYSTKSVTTTIATVSVDDIVATQTVTATETVKVPPNPVETVFLRAFGSGDSFLQSSGGVGFGELESEDGGHSVFNIRFGNNYLTNQRYGINTGTGEMTARNRPGIATGESLYYNMFGGLAPASYVRVGPDAAAADGNGAELLVCKILQVEGSEPLQCKWGPDQIADFWTCNQRLFIVLPDYDFSGICDDGGIFYKVPLIQAIRL